MVTKKIIKEFNTTPTNATIIDSLESDDTSNGLSAAKGKQLLGMIQNLKVRIDNFSEKVDTKALYINGELALHDPDVTPNPQDPGNVDFGSSSSSGTGAYIKELPGAGFHNSIYRGKDLTNVYPITGLDSRIKNGKFSDLYIGDYYTTQINSSTVKLTIAGFDLFSISDVAIPSGATPEGYEHNITFICDGLGTAKMNTTDTTVNGLNGSSLKINQLDTFSTTFQTALPNLVAINTRLSSTVINGEVTAITNKTLVVNLMSEINVFGSQVFCNIGTDTGTCSIQFPLFRLNPNSIDIGDLYWLSNIVSNTEFSAVYKNKPAYRTASTQIGLRPFIVMK